MITYNANGSTASPTNGLAYIGQDLYVSGQEVGKRLASLMKKGDTAVGFIAQPGSLNIQPRMDGATQALQAAGMKVMFGNKGVDTGASATQEAQVLPQFLQSRRVQHPGRLRGRRRRHRPARPFAGGNTAWSARCTAGGFDLEPQTSTAISAGQLDFTIDQSPYLQGFLPTLYMYLFQLSGGLVSPRATDTGLKFVTKSNVGPVHRGADPVRGLDLGAEVHSAHRADHRLTGSWQAGNSRPAAVHRCHKPWVNRRGAWV